VTRTQLTIFVPLYYCNHVTLDMATAAANTCWWENYD